MTTDSTIQRPEQLKFRELQHSRLIFVLGPWGSGKTFLARHLVENFKQYFPEHDNEVVAIYVAPDLVYSPCPSIVEVSKIREGEVFGSPRGTRTWIRATDLESSDLFEAGLNRGELNKPDHWKILVERLPDNQRLVVVIDDYDKWRAYVLGQRQITSRDFEVMDKLIETNRVIFVLTGEIHPLRPPGSKLSDEERSFLSHWTLVQTVLQSDEVARRIVEESWQLGEIGCNDSKKGLAERIIDCAGNYPLLIVTIAKALPTSDKGIGDGTWNQLERIIDQAAKSKEFQGVVACRWKNLDDHPGKTVLRLAVIAQQAKRSLENVYKLYNRSYEGGNRMTEEQFNEGLENLRRRDLLLKPDNSLASTAVLQSVLEDPGIKSLGEKLGISLKDRTFNFNTFLWLWLFGFVLYLVLLAVKVFVVEAQFDFHFPNGFLLLVWLPAIGYGLWHVRTR